MIHLIAIGGAVMHNLALELKRQGKDVSGSDDEIFEPSFSRLQDAGILPEAMGWFSDKITPDLECVVLGMHARADNPELLRAQELGLPIYSFPEFIFQHSKNKKRIVVAGSHGKTTTTAMLLHALRLNNVDCDYLVGAQLEGFDTMVRLSDAPLLVVEGDEYLASPIDRRPKFLLYEPHVAIITGVAWDHINVFPTYDLYKNQFALLAECLPKDGLLIWCEEDKDLKELIENKEIACRKMPYHTLSYRIEDGKTVAEWGGGETDLQIFGAHNLQNMQAARLACREAGLSDKQFFTAMASFKGAARRLEQLGTGESSTVWVDFAHAPSKVAATVAAAREQHPSRKLTAVLELHTFSSLNPAFLPHYKGALDKADVAAVFVDDHTLALKRMEPIDDEVLRNAFGRPDLHLFRKTDELVAFLEKIDYQNDDLLLMSSGKFGSKDVKHVYWQSIAHRFKKN